MADYTYATVIVSDQKAAQADFPNYFQTGLSASGNAPATSWVSSGPFDNKELDQMVNLVTWKRNIYFGGDVSSVLAGLNLTIVSTP